MKISSLFKSLFLSFMHLSMGIVEETGGGTDRGDDFQPTGDDTKQTDATELKNPLEDEAEKAADGTGSDDAADDATKAEEDKTNKNIPLARHKDILSKKVAEIDRLNAELARTRGVEQSKQETERFAESETKIESLEKEYNKLLADGEIEKASAKMTEIRRMEREVTEYRTAKQAELAQAQAVETVRYQTTLERVEAAFPVLNEDHEDYDEEVVGEVAALMKSFRATGDSASAALQRAVKYVLRPETKKQESATETKVRVDSKAVEKTRREQAIERNVDAAKRTPANTAKAGTDNTDGGVLTADKVMKMSQAAFAKLDEKELERLRGDTL
jgi:hypothetical protein